MHALVQLYLMAIINLFNNNQVLNNSIISSKMSGQPLIGYSSNYRKTLYEFESI